MKTQTTITLEGENRVFAKTNKINISKTTDYSISLLRLSGFKSLEGYIGHLKEKADLQGERFNKVLDLLPEPQRLEVCRKIFDE